MDANLIILGALIAASVGLLAYALWPRTGEDREHVMRRMMGKRSSDGQASLLRDSKKANAARQVLDRVAPIAMKPVMPKSDEEISTLRERLCSAGFHAEYAVG